MALNESPFRDQRQTAKYLGLPERTLEQMRCQGTGPAYCKFGRRVFYHRDDLAAYIESSRRQSTTQRPRAA